LDANVSRHGLATAVSESNGAFTSKASGDKTPEARGGRALLEFADLRAYDWLNIPAWIYDGERSRYGWANAAGLRFWRAENVQESYWACRWSPMSFAAWKHSTTPPFWSASTG
jgi:hypothetical protein